MHLIRCSFSSSVQPNLLPQSKHWIERTDTRQRFLRGVGDTLAAPALRRPIVGFVELYAPFSADNDKSCSVTWVSSHWLYVKTLEQCSLRNLPHFGGDLFGFEALTMIFESTPWQQLPGTQVAFLLSFFFSLVREDVALVVRTLHKGPATHVTLVQFATCVH